MIARRRRIVVGSTLVPGTILLGATLRVPNGSGWFVVLGLLLAATWTIGAWLSGPIPFRSSDRTGWSREVLVAVGIGAATYLGFLAVFLLVRNIAFLADALDSVLDQADAGPSLVVLVIALVNGAAEELFFRGALPDAFEPRHREIAPTVVYVAVTAATGNIALVAAALVMGVVLNRQRILTGGVMSPIVTHVTWSTLMLLALPR